jgi:phosphate-selective porin OprO/OprP
LSRLPVFLPVVSVACFVSSAAAQEPTADPSSIEAGAQSPAPPEKKGKGLEARYDGGFLLTDAEGDFKLKVGGYAQFDARFFPGDEDEKLPDTFVARRVRPVIEGTLFGLFDLRMMTDFGGGRVVVQDAYGDIHPAPWLRLRVGKFKAPFGLERLQSATALHFVERAFPTALAPNRDLGVMVHGRIVEGTVEYGLGIFNGVADGASGDLDLGDGKDVVARLFVRPFRPTDVELLHEIGIGVAASYGDADGTLEAPEQSAARTAGQASLFGYVTGETEADTAIAQGERLRIGPQAYAYVGPVGLQLEYTRTRQAVVLGATEGDASVFAWQVAANVVVTGENASFEGVKPDDAVGDGGVGAFELAARVSQLNPSEEIFVDDFADGDRSADVALAWAVGATWHLARPVKLQLDFERTTFKRGVAPNPDDRPAENALLTRLQLVL